MTWRFRQSFKILPGLKLNLSKSGLSASVGGAPFTVNLGPRGAMATASLPGTGISFRQQFSGGPTTRHGTSGRQPPDLPGNWEHLGSPPDLPASPAFALPREIRSASTELLTSESLQQFKQLIQEAYAEHEQIAAQLSNATRENTRASARFRSWDQGFLLKKLFKSSFAVRRAEAEISAARVSELEEKLRLTTISTEVELDKEQAEAFFRLRDQFTLLSQCAAIWDVKAEEPTDQFRERTTATRKVTRERVKFSLGTCDLINWDYTIPHLGNANGGDMFLFPGFILYRASKAAFSVIDFHDVQLTTASVRFQEEESLPTDAKTVARTWAKANKDGSRDRRFADNYEIPVVLYGRLTLKSGTGLWEEFQVSNPEPLQPFAKAWAEFAASFNHRISFTVLEPGQEVSEPPSDIVPPLDQPLPTTIHFECTGCRQPIEVNADAAGQEFRCPGCGEKLVVPEAT